MSETDYGRRLQSLRRYQKLFQINMYIKLWTNDYQILCKVGHFGAKVKLTFKEKH